MNADIRDWARIIGAEVVLLAVIALGIVLLVNGASGADRDDALSDPTPVTVVLDDLTPHVAANYTYAKSHMTEFAQIPCYCGCDNMLGHRNLADCYVTTTGGWDAHASGCAVCAQETDTVRAALSTGTAIADVRDSIINQYGPPPGGFSDGDASA